MQVALELFTKLNLYIPVTSQLKTMDPTEARFQPNLS
jgi:hypothetical protein